MKQSLLIKVAYEGCPISEVTYQHYILCNELMGADKSYKVFLFHIIKFSLSKIFFNLDEMKKHSLE